MRKNEIKQTTRQMNPYEFFSHCLLLLEAAYKHICWCSLQRRPRLLGGFSVLSVLRGSPSIGRVHGPQVSTPHFPIQKLPAVQVFPDPAPPPRKRVPVPRHSWWRPRLRRHGTMTRHSNSLCSQVPMSLSLSTYRTVLHNHLTQRHANRLALVSSMDNHTS